MSRYGRLGQRTADTVPGWDFLTWAFVWTGPAMDSDQDAINSCLNRSWLEFCPTREREQRNGGAKDVAAMARPISFLLPRHSGSSDVCRESIDSLLETQQTHLGRW